MKGKFLRDFEHPTVLGYELDRVTLTPIRRQIDTARPEITAPIHSATACFAWSLPGTSSPTRKN